MRCLHCLIAVAGISLLLVGCARTDKFDVSVRNDTAGPLTLALTKDGPPFERVWAGPEDLAIESPRADEQHGFVVLPPGKEADVAIEGKFDRGTRGYLRVYRGDLQISDMTAIGPASPNRIDLPLQPGTNRFVIADANGRLAHKP
jgi:hypothetical protein